MATFTLGILGYGHFGAFLHRMAERFIPDVTVRVHTRSRKPGDGVFTTFEEAVDSDALLLCVPIGVYEETLHAIKDLLRPETILIDVATVKRHTGDLIRAIVPGQPHICTHPMFGPESYTKQGGDVTGFRIVITETNLPDATVEPIRSMLRREGFDIVEKTADEHDRELAETLFLTHYVGQVIARGGFERTEIDTVSFGFLMDAVDSVRHDTRLFEEVCRFNSYCEEVVRRFDRSERDVKERLLNLPPSA
ncbi:MAG: prephenate dehydrogenase/arogenate dehydrogenase family protein [Alphaproteobacteria bacterium]|uniref:prephenate dehydrogenase/arogenate dehydrogenase family protein n=1 Tax=Pacificispira sp. TaxID=2888761 RepID=UPI001B031872|nr:prephenate dehydrogenase/arogenate dehydrogenase family protein [Alphaproteobacteria bacterium]MBO6864594.1 prephenate dehydrogenase/arogenate dehydrogenase family protein [Alphaproteobacteria bacterium]MEC9264614.1 prephenate dehydrogenase/arogenate dehydrogenase family protein [Pseudomonadota bacterium]